jgi:putative integral membrane protein (TIGR02587 family)
MESPWAREGLALVRAASGGLLFGVPLLYTMEVWWVGSHTDPPQMLLILGLLFLPLLALNATAGFRDARDVRLVDALDDSIEAMAVGIVMTASVLLLLRQITVDTPMPTALGRIVNECIPFCLGVGVARFLLQGDPGMAEEEPDAGPDGPTDEPARDTSVADLGATTLGAVFVGLSIAPTDEVPMVASAISPVWLLLVVAASLVISYAVVFVAGFSGQDRRHQQHGIFQRPITETLVTYLMALVVAAVLLWAFQRDLTPPSDLLTRVLVLGLPAAVGGAVGRLAI